MPASRRVHVAKALALATVLFGMSFYTIGAILKPGYSSGSQYISELNATGTEHAEALGLFGFLPLGLLVAAFLWVATPVAAVEGTSRTGWWLLWSQPVAFISVYLAPCDAGCPESGSMTQAIHNALGLLTYFAGATGLFLVASAPVLRGTDARTFLRFSGVSFVVLFVVMLLPELAGVRGLLQRSADVLLGGALLVLAWRVVGR